MYLFNHMSMLGIAFTLIATLIFKYYAVEWVLKTNYAQTATVGQGWVGALVTNVLLNAALTFVILFAFTGLVGAIVIAAIDALIHYLLGYWKKRSHLPSVQVKDLISVYNMVNFIHTSSYVGIAGLVLKYVFPHSPAAQAATAFVP